MKILDGVMVCCDYADFLAYSLPAAKPQFNRLVVVTAPHDISTQRLCRFYHVDCVVSDIFYQDGYKFNKGAAVNLGLERLDFQDWVVHLDSDVVVPPRFKEMVLRKDLSEQCLYGVDRFMIRSYEEWAEFLAAPEIQHEMGRTNTDTFKIGYRVVQTKADFGYVPIGFLQLFNRRSGYLGEPFYPTQHDGAARSDLEFALRWPATHRHLLPEMMVYHLEAEGAAELGNGANWEGRKTPTFGPRRNYVR